jgi:hypothetical protein
VVIVVAFAVLFLLACALAGAVQILLDLNDQNSE